MKCDKVQLLCEPHLDSELDARTAVEIEQHLKTCPNCAALFAEAARLDARIAAGLNRGQRTNDLWERIEDSVVAAADSAVAKPIAPPVSVLDGWRTMLLALTSQLKAGWVRSSKAWTGLVALWVVICALHFAARGSDSTILATQTLPPAAAMRYAWTQNQLLMAELADTLPPTPADKPKPPPPGPRGDLRNETPYV